jgi:hypothetical protein
MTGIFEGDMLPQDWTTPDLSHRLDFTLVSQRRRQAAI